MADQPLPNPVVDYSIRLASPSCNKATPDLVMDDVASVRGETNVVFDDSTGRADELRDPRGVVDEKLGFIRVV